MSSVPISRSAVVQPTTNTAAMHRLGLLYRLHDTSVAEYLAQQPPLVDFLLEAYPEVEQSFGKQPSITLELVYDPEYVGPPDLFALIRVHLTVDEAHARLNQFDAWYLDQPINIAALVTFDLEFV